MGTLGFLIDAIIEPGLLIKIDGLYILLFSREGSIAGTIIDRFRQAESHYVFQLNVGVRNSGEKLGNVIPQELAELRFYYAETHLAAHYLYVMIVSYRG